MAMSKKNVCSVNSEEDQLLKHEISVIQGILHSKEQYRQIIKAGIAKWVTDFKQGRIEIRTVDDLRKLIEMDIALQKEEL